LEKTVTEKVGSLKGEPHASNALTGKNGRLKNKTVQWWRGKGRIGYSI